MKTELIRLKKCTTILLSSANSVAIKCIIAEMKKKRQDLPFKTTIDIIGHEEKHAQLLQGDELHIPLITQAAAQPLQKSLRVWVSHLKQTNNRYNTTTKERNKTIVTHYFNESRIRGSSPHGDRNHRDTVIYTGDLVM